MSQKSLNYIAIHISTLYPRMKAKLHQQRQDIMDALAKSADNLDIDFRERMVPEEMIKEILELHLGTIFGLPTWSQKLV